MDKRDTFQLKKIQFFGWHHFKFRGFFFFFLDFQGYKNSWPMIQTYTYINMVEIATTDLYATKTIKIGILRILMKKTVKHVKKVSTV